jgi:hypothetical protein
MPSAALGQWRSTSRDALAQIEAAHGALGGRAPGRRYATLQINHAYAVMVSSQFQGFCRSLHSAAVDVLATSTEPTNVAVVLRSALMQGRKLDVGNASPSNLGADFGRLGMAFWDEVRALDARNDGRKDRLQELNEWRNAIAHQDFTRFGGRDELRLGAVRGWRAACDALAACFDRAGRIAPGASGRTVALVIE